MCLKGTVVHGRHLVSVPENMVRIPYGAVHVTAGVIGFHDDIAALMNGVGVLLHGFLRIQIEGKLLIFHRDKGKGFSCNLLCVGRHSRHLIPHKADGLVKHQLGGIDVLILTVSIVTVLWRILVADNGMDPLQSLGLGGVNGLNPGMGNG